MTLWIILCITFVWCSIVLLSWFWVVFKISEDDITLSCLLVAIPFAVLGPFAAFNVVQVFGEDIVVIRRTSD